MSWEDLHGWFDFEDIYDQAIAEARDGSILVEMGVAYGRSLAYLARRAIESGKELTIYGVDLWFPDCSEWRSHPFSQSSEVRGPFGACCLGMLAYAPEEFERVNLLRTSSYNAARMINATSAYGADFVFIDGDHEEKSVRADLDAWVPVVRPGGVIAGHDHTDNHPGVEKAVRDRFGSAYEVRGSSWWKRL